MILGNSKAEKISMITLKVLEPIFFGKTINKIKIILPKEDILVKKKNGFTNKILISNTKDREEIPLFINRKEPLYRQFVMSTSILSFLFLCILKSAAIYYENEEGIYILLGRSFIWKKGEGYYIKINKKMRSKSESLQYKLLFLNSFCRKEKGTDIVILYGKLEIYEKIRKEIIIHLFLVDKVTF